MPNQKINKIVEKIENGVIDYNFSETPPRLIIETLKKDHETYYHSFKLENPGYKIRPNEIIAGTGYRHTPTHYEWCLLLKDLKKTQPDQYDLLYNIFINEKPGCENELKIIRSDIIVFIGLEKNQWKHKGGVPNQVAVYLKYNGRPQNGFYKINYKPTFWELYKQLKLAHSLYGRDGADGLKAEVFDRV